MRTHQNKDKNGEAPGALASDAAVTGAESHTDRREAFQIAVERYEKKVAALELAVSSLPNLGTLVVTTDRHRQSELRHVLRQGHQFAEAEATERRVIERMSLSKRNKENLSGLFRRGAESRRSVQALCERADELFSGGREIPATPALLSADEEKGLFRALQGYRERFLVALHMVPFIQEHVVDFLQSVRDEGVKVSQVIVTKRSKGASEEQLDRHVDTNLATVRGILSKQGESPGIKSGEKIARLLIETPLTMGRIFKLVKELELRTSELQELEARLHERHNGDIQSLALDEPTYKLYLRRVRELGGGSEFAKAQFETLKVLREPFQRIQDYILNANRRLVGKWVSTLTRSAVGQEDLMQEATIGLMIAVDKYDVDTGLKFSTVASWWIMQAVQRKRLMNQGAMEIPGHQLPAIARLSKFDSEHGSVGAVEAAKSLDMRPEMVQALRVCLRPVASLSVRPKHSGDKSRSLSELIRVPQLESVPDAASRGELRDNLELAFRVLQPRLATILKMRFGLEGKPMTLAEVGERLGITRERVRQLEATALAKLRRNSNSVVLEKFAE